MAIQDKIGANPAKANCHISFNGKSNNHNLEMPNGGLGLVGALPLAILMVASPMNPVSAAEQNNRYMAAQPTELVYTPQEESLPEDTYMLVPSNQEPEKPQKKDKEVFMLRKYADNQHLQIHGFSSDSTTKSADKMFIIYRNYEKNRNYQLKAKLFAFCPTPREDGRYIVFWVLKDMTS